MAVTSIFQVPQEKRRTLAEKFWSRVSKSEGCWTFRGPHQNGYGRFGTTFGSRSQQFEIRPHRLSYELTIGPIPQGLDLDHLCRNRGCVNPAHLEPVTRRTNLMRGNSISALESRQTHCKRGHALTLDNLRSYELKLGKRNCRTCVNELQRLRRQKVKVVVKA